MSESLVPRLALRTGTGLPVGTCRVPGAVSSRVFSVFVHCVLAVFPVFTVCKRLCFDASL